MDAIFKFQPHRTMHLQGFDAYGAAAALWGASDSGFNVSGVFRDQGDFAVLVLFQKDDPFGHPRFSYLSDGNLTGLKLDFDIEWQGIQAFESKKWPWIDWAYLNCDDASGVLQLKRLSELATGPSGRTGASGTFTLNAGTPQVGDRVTLWYQNKAFDYTVSSQTSPSCVESMFWQSGQSCVQALWWQGSTLSCIQALWWQGNAAYNHWVTIGSRTYTCLEDSLSSGGVANNIAAQINASDPNCSASVGGAYGNEITIALRSGVSGPVQVSSSDGSGTATLNNYLHWVKIGGATYSVAEGSLNSAEIASAIAAQINASDPNCTAATGGAYGNEITVALRNGVAGPAQVSSSDGSGTATLVNPAHWVKIGATTYSVLQDSLTSAQIASAIATQINATDPNCTAVAGGVSGNEIAIALRNGVIGPVDVSSSDGSAGATLASVNLADICANIAAQINSMDWVANGPVALSAAASGNQITITAEPGADGNMLAFYELHSSANLYFTPAAVQLAGGSSDNVKWHITTDFSALGWTDIQKLWITFAPALANSAAYAPTEWQVSVTNWTLTDPGGVRPLKVAGPGSVRIEEDNPWVVCAGYWEDPSIVDPKVAAYWSRGRAIRSAYSAYESRTLTIETHCQATHDIYLGTWLDSNCGIISATLDGGAPVTPDCYGPGMLARRRLFASVAAGKHTVVLAMTSNKNANSGGWYFYFDFLECAVLSDVPDAPQVRTDVGMSADFDTDNTYKLSPQRLLWNLQKLGLVGGIDHYVGVFWWNQRKAVGGHYPSATVTFGGTWADQDVIWLNIGGTYSNGTVTGGTALGKTVFPMDTSSTIASHFANFINATLVGVWASANGPVLTITTRSTSTNWLYSLITQTNSAQGSVAVSNGSTHVVNGQTFTTSNDLRTGAADPAWVIDPTAAPVLNRAFRDWHADYFTALKAAGLGVTASFSQELVNPPDDPGGGAVWVQRFPDGTAVETDTGFASLKSSMCAFGTAVRGYMASAYIQMAELMAGAGLPPRLQFGEVLWWYVAGSSGMAFYDADTTAAASAALGRALATFHTANDDPSVNGYADANFLRSRLGSYVAAVQLAVLATVPSALFELLWPLDVNDPDNRRLLHYVNLPPAWQARAGSGFDTVLCEGFQYAGIDHDLDKAKRCAAYPFAELSWDRAHCRYLMGWYNSGWPWQREYQAAQRTGIPLIKFWAYDHLCLFGWPLPLPKQPSSPSFI